MILRQNLLKRGLERGETVLGCSINESRAPGMVYTMATAGAGLVFLDLEHNPHNTETVIDLVAHAHAAGVTPLIRPPQIEYGWMTRLLDGGCQSLLIPGVSQRAEVERLVELSFYRPRGRRGVAMVGGAGVNYQQVTDVAEAMAWSNDQVLLALVIETPEAVEDLPELVLPEIELLFVGYQDLAQGYGAPGEVSHPLVTAAEDRVRALCRDRGIAYGVFQPDLARVAEEIGAGARVVVHGGVFAFVRRGVREAAAVMAGAAALDTAKNNPFK